MAYFNTLAEAEAFTAAEALPSIAVEVFDIAWIAGSPIITYAVNTAYYLG
jgi:hypothetical protein